jgi:hypothetical protein
MKLSVITSAAAILAAILSSGFSFGQVETLGEQQEMPLQEVNSLEQVMLQT